MSSRDPRLNRAVVAIMNAKRQGTAADLVEAKRDLAVARLLVAVEREIEQAKPLTDSEAAAVINLLDISIGGGAA